MRETTGAVVVGAMEVVLLSIIGLIVVGISRLVLLVGVLEAAEAAHNNRAIRVTQGRLVVRGLVHRH